MGVRGMPRVGIGLAAAVLLGATVTGCGGGDEHSGHEMTVVPVAAPAVLQGFSHPESVLVAGDVWFVSNVGPARDATAKDGDGFLSRLDQTGKLTELKAIPRSGDAPLNAPKGMAYTGNKVFVADIDRVVGYDANTLGQVFEAKLEGDAPALLNDIAVLDGKTLLVTDSLRGSVYKLDLESKRFGTVTTAVPGANGVVADQTGRTVYVAALGADFKGGDLFVLDLARIPAQPKKIGTVHGILDGLALLPDGNLAVSDWVSVEPPTAGTITIYRPDGTAAAAVKLPENLIGPADFTVDGSGRNLLVPGMADNKVAIVELG
ncbi:hypothetical protein ACWDYH_38590 [Nocardia goodfellowii]